MRSANALLEDIAAFAPVSGDWRALDALVEQLWAVGIREVHLPTLFGVFERYPDEDGVGVLWSIVHGLEGLPFEYEAELHRSIARCPSFMADVMRRRLENGRR